MSPRFLVGIDLGTTHTVVAYAELTRPDPQPFLLRQLVSAGEVAPRLLLPSCLYAPPPEERARLPEGEDATFVLGVHARRRGAEVPGRLVVSAKSWLCHGGVDREGAILPWGADDEGTPRISPVDASARVLEHVRRRWDEAFPGAPLAEQEIVLTVPASFDAAARELTTAAVQRAGLKARLLEEPQAAFHDWMHRQGEAGLAGLLAGREEATVLVCDVGGGTTDFTLIRVNRGADGPGVQRLAVGDHLLLGGDNMDLALAHFCEARLSGEGAAPGKLSPARFAQLVAACRSAKELLMGEDPPEETSVTLLGEGSRLLAATRRAVLRREDAERLLLDGFFPRVPLDDALLRGRGGLVSFGLPYARDAAITRHLAHFLRRHGPSPDRHATPDVVVLNGGVFHGRAFAERLALVMASWTDIAPRLLPHADPDLAVARGAVAYGLARRGLGRRIAGGSPRAYYLGVGQDRAVCLLPRGAEPGTIHRVDLALSLLVGRPARFDLFASSSERGDLPGAVVHLDPDDFTRLPPVATAVEASSRGEIPVHLEGELTELGTLDVACVEQQSPSPRRFRLAFQLRQAEDEAPAPSVPPSAAPGSFRPHAASTQPPPASTRWSPVSTPPPPASTQPPPASTQSFSASTPSSPASVRPPPASVRPPPGSTRSPSLLPPSLVPGSTARSPASYSPRRLEEGRALLDRVFGKGGATQAGREVKDLLRDLEKALGERPTWSIEVGRELFDHLMTGARARRRSAEHERLFWMLAGYTLRPGMGHPGDTERTAALVHLWPEGVHHRKEPRVWQQHWIAWRRVAAGLDEAAQLAIRDGTDVFLRPDAPKKGPRPEALDDLLALASWLERPPASRRAELGSWLIERSWTSQDARLWEALGRLGARVPIYASAHQTLAPRVVEPWLEELLRARWIDIPSAPLAATRLARMTGDRARDVSERLRNEVKKRLEAGKARPAWIAAVTEVIEEGEAERAEAFGESLPVGLRLLDD
jgi:molecular chaperone DnaK (HSP70)